MERSQNSFCVCDSQSQFCVCVCVCEGILLCSRYRPTQMSNVLRDWTLGDQQIRIHLLFVNSDSKVTFRCKMPRSYHFLLLCLALRHSKKKGVSGLSTPATGRTSLTVFLSRIGIVGIGKPLDVLWFHSRCLHGENYCILEMIRHISPWQGLTVTVLTVFLLNLVWCLMDTHLLTSLGWLSSLSMSAGVREKFSQRIASVVR